MSNWFLNTFIRLKSKLWFLLICNRFNDLLLFIKPSLIHSNYYTLTYYFQRNFLSHRPKYFNSLQNYFRREGYTVSQTHSFVYIDRNLIQRTEPLRVSPGERIVALEKISVEVFPIYMSKLGLNRMKEILARYRSS